MVPSWLHTLSIVWLLLGVACAVVVALHLRRHPQHMWIMNVVWPVTALFGTVWVVWQYYVYGRLAESSKAHAATERHEEMPSIARTPFAVAVANGARYCGSGCTLGDICAEWLAFFTPAFAVWLGWHSLFETKMFAVWILDYILPMRSAFLPVFYHCANARPVFLGWHHRGDRGGHVVTHGLAGRHVRVHGVRLFRHFP